MGERSIDFFETHAIIRHHLLDADRCDGRVGEEEEEEETPI